VNVSRVPLPSLSYAPLNVRPNHLHTTPADPAGRRTRWILHRREWSGRLLRPQAAGAQEACMSDQQSTGEPWPPASGLPRATG
jgi:hypothetical protein